MIQIPRPAALVVLLALAACGRPVPTDDGPAPAPVEVPAPVPAPTPAPVAAAVTLDESGLTLAAGKVAFGQPMDAAVATLTAALGAPGERSVNSECGAGETTFVQWPNGLSALFLDGKFSGWSVARSSTAGLKTDKGVGVGSTRADLLTAYPGATVEVTTLGQEFAAGEYSGIFDGAAQESKIDTLWAGTSCVFR